MLGRQTGPTDDRRRATASQRTTGGVDASCPAALIESLFERLPATRMYCYLQGQEHDYAQEFVALAAAWFRLYA
jgi:hypothetical protein